VLATARRITVAILIGVAPSMAGAQERSPAPTPRVDREPSNERERSAREVSRNRADSLFVSGDVKSALDALNEVGEPHVGAVKVEGLVRSKRTQVYDYLDVRPGELLTAGKLSRLERRVDELPTASYGLARYDPIAGSATVTPIVFERDLFPTGMADLAAIGVRAAVQQEIRVNIANPFGWGELWTPAYRYDGRRPRALLRLDVPAPGGLPGVLHVNTLWERQTYLNPASAAIFEETRVRATAGLADWLTGWLRWEGAGGVDYIASTTYAVLGGSLNLRGLNDRLAFVVGGGRWLAAGDGESFSSVEAVLMARSTSRIDRPVVRVLAGISAVGDVAPLAVWPGASSGQGRGPLLRAHALHEDGIVTGEGLGRRLFFGNAEYVYPIATPLGFVGVAGFVDVVRAGRRLDSTASLVHVDLGTGVRINTSRSGKQQVRLDVGYGLRDRRWKVSAGYVVPWGVERVNE
jgi:hypothetical protein